MLTLIRFLLAGVLGFVAAVEARAQRDQVYPLRGAPLSGEIVSTSPTEVTIKVAGSDRSIAVNEIRRVSFAEDPQELKTARTRASSGDFQSALDTLKRANPNAIERPIIKTDFQFYAAYCMGKLALTRGGDKNQAAALVLKFITGNPTSHHFFAAAELLGDLALSLGSLPNAVKYYGAISARAPWPEYKFRGTLLEARAMVALGQYAEAKAKFDTIISGSEATPETQRIKQLAQVGRARCLAETASADEAIASLEEIIGSGDENDSELFGRAYNALGNCLLKQDKPKEALMAFLHVDVLFFAESDVHAEALYHLATLWETVKKTDRAVAARNMLSDRYAGSMWASK